MGKITENIKTKIDSLMKQGRNQTDNLSFANSIKMLEKYFQEVFSIKERYSVTPQEKKRYEELIRKDTLDIEEKVFLNSVMLKLVNRILTSEEKEELKLRDDYLNDRYKELSVREKATYTRLEDELQELSKRELKEEKLQLETLKKVSKNINDNRLNEKDREYIKSLGLDSNYQKREDLKYLDSVLNNMIKMKENEIYLRSEGKHENNHLLLVDKAEEYTFAKALNVLNAAVRQMPDFQNVNIPIKYEKDFVSSNTYATYSNGSIYVSRNLLVDLIEGENIYKAIAKVFEEYDKQIQIKENNLSEHKIDKNNRIKSNFYNYKGEFEAIVEGYNNLKNVLPQATEDPLRKVLERLNNKSTVQDFYEIATYIERGKLYQNEPRSNMQTQNITNNFFDNFINEVNDENVKALLSQDRERNQKQGNNAGYLKEEYIKLYEQFNDYVQKNGKILVDALKKMEDEKLKERAITSVENIIRDSQVNYNKEINNLIDGNLSEQTLGCLKSQKFYYELAKRPIADAVKVLNACEKIERMNRLTNDISSFVLDNYKNYFPKFLGISLEQFNDKLIDGALQNCKNSPETLNYLTLIEINSLHNSPLDRILNSIDKAHKPIKYPLHEKIMKMSPSEFVNNIYKQMEPKDKKQYDRYGLSTAEITCCMLLLKGVFEAGSDPYEPLTKEEADWVYQVIKQIPDSRLAKMVAEITSNDFHYDDFPNLKNLKSEIQKINKR